MLKIAICDDNEAVNNEIENILEEYFSTESIKYEIDIFFSGEDIINILNKNEKYDLIYLDIELDTINGVEVGKFIREELSDDNVQIAFISAKSSYAMELFQIRPINFLIKPFTKEQVLNILEKTLDLKGRKTKMFYYKNGRVEKRVPYKDIMYFSSEYKKVILHMKNRKDYFYGKLIDLILPKEDFICIHKSFIVNKQYVVQFKFDNVILSNNEILPISRAYRKEVREKLRLQNRGVF